MNENEIGKIVVDCAVRLHKELGSGLFETVYEVLLAHELELTRTESRTAGCDSYRISRDKI